MTAVDIAEQEAYDSLIKIISAINLRFKYKFRVEFNKEDYRLPSGRLANVIYIANDQLGKYANHHMRIVGDDATYKNMLNFVLENGFIMGPDVSSTVIQLERFDFGKTYEEMMMKLELNDIE